MGKGSSEAAQLPGGLWAAPHCPELISGILHRAWACSHLTHLGPYNTPRAPRHHREPLEFCWSLPISTAGIRFQPSSSSWLARWPAEPLFSHGEIASASAGRCGAVDDTRYGDYMSKFAWHSLGCVYCQVTLTNSAHGVQCGWWPRWMSMTTNRCVCFGCWMWLDDDIANSVTVTARSSVGLHYIKPKKKILTSSCFQWIKTSFIFLIRKYHNLHIKKCNKYMSFFLFPPLAL